MKIIVLNYDYSYLNSVSLHKAMLYIAKGKAMIEKESGKIIKTMTDKFSIPLVIRMTKLILAVYRRGVHWSKKNVMVRDGFQCVYCGSKSNLNIDHVIPKAQNGNNSFENTVCACKTCNNRKGSRTPSEAGIYFRKRGWKPTAPTVMEFLILYHKKMGIYKLLQDYGIY